MTSYTSSSSEDKILVSETQSEVSNITDLNQTSTIHLQMDDNFDLNSIQNSEIKKLPKSHWQKSDDCYICERIFSIKHPRHHCRSCGKSICGYCSKNKVKKLRVCDICNFRYKNKEYENIKKEYLIELDAQNFSLEDKSRDLREKIGELKIKEEQIIKTNEKKLEVKKKELFESESNLDNLEKLVESKKQEIEKKEEGIRQREDIIKKYEENIKTFENDIEFEQIGFQMQKELTEKNNRKRKILMKIISKLRDLELHSGMTNDESVVKEIEKIEIEIKNLKNIQ